MPRTPAVATSRLALVVAALAGLASCSPGVDVRAPREVAIHRKLVARTTLLTDPSRVRALHTALRSCRLALLPVVFEDLPLREYGRIILVVLDPPTDGRLGLLYVRPSQAGLAFSGVEVKRHQKVIVDPTIFAIDIGEGEEWFVYLTAAGGDDDAGMATWPDVGTATNPHCPRNMTAIIRLGLSYATPPPSGERALPGAIIHVRVLSNDARP